MPLQSRLDPAAFEMHLGLRLRGYTKACRTRAFGHRQRGGGGGKDRR